MWQPNPRAEAAIVRARAALSELPADRVPGELRNAVAAAEHALRHGCVGPQIEEILLQEEEES